MKFKTREEAAKLLVKALAQYKGQNPLVLGIPRGAVPMAKIIAEGLQGEVGVVLVHKIPAPNNEELAVGSVGLSGNIQYSPYTFDGITEAYIAQAAAKQLQVLKSRQQKYGLKTPDYTNRIVIIVDDGIATGATVLSAISEVKSQTPKKIIIATAVTAQDSARKIRSSADELVALYEPKEFYAVGQFFDNFAQVSDEDVIKILKE